MGAQLTSGRPRCKTCLCCLCSLSGSYRRVLGGDEYAQGRVPKWEVLLTYARQRARSDLRALATMDDAVEILAPFLCEWLWRHVWSCIMGCPSKSFCREDGQAAVAGETPLRQERLLAASSDGPLSDIESPQDSAGESQSASQVQYLLDRRQRAINANEGGARKKVKDVTVSVEDLTELILNSTTANGDVVDATGLTWPWEMLSPDRIDPNRGYVKGNIRWLLTGLNLFRRDCPSDVLLKEWYLYGA